MSPLGCFAKLRIYYTNQGAVCKISTV